ncbi:PEP-CTERM sorting domain-containing protein [Nostoc sp. S13]|uniref:PEP-CTERM sorting domain-containing protein n=1 Tax=Nostoc sp. S13 TaxID=3019266 RepID=UPI003412455A
MGSIFPELANAATVKISSYDVTNTHLSGFGGWNHNYNGTINSNGNGTYNYSDGSGTLNDGLIGTDLGNTHLFFKSDNSTISTFLNQKSTIANIKLFSYGPTDNGIPGNIDAVNITINGISQTFSTIGFQPEGIPPNNINRLVNELIDFSNSIFPNVVSDKVTFSNFQTSGNFPEYYSISEIVFDQAAASVPEPLSLGGIAVAGAMGLWMKRKRKASSTV